MPARTLPRLVFLSLSLALLLAPAAGVRAAEGQDDAVRWSQIAVGKSQLQFYGFLRLDLISDSARMDSFQTPFFVFSDEDPNVSAADQGTFSMHPRLTRLGMNFRGPQPASEGSARFSGNLEMDFQNGGRESRPIIRIRHAWFKAAWGTLSVLGGQTWDAFSPLFPTVNNDSLMWNAGNLGDRRPQLRMAWEPKAGRGAWSLVGGSGLTGAVDSKDLDNNGVRDGEASARPNAQGRAGYSRPIGGDEARKWSVGLSGHYAWEETAGRIAGDTTFRSYSANLDVKVPFHKRLSVQGEAWTGSNLSDFRGGAGQGVNTIRGDEIDARGGWLELMVKAGRSLSFHPGYTIDDPRNDDVPAAGRTKNRAWYLVNRWQPDPSFLAGIDFLYWVTDWKGLEDGTDRRVNLYLQYNF